MFNEILSEQTTKVESPVATPRIEIYPARARSESHGKKLTPNLQAIFNSFKGVPTKHELKRKKFMNNPSLI